MSPDVQVAVISAAAAVIVAVLELFRRELKGTKREARETRVQVQNEHHTNLRDDLDGIAADVRRSVEQNELLIDRHDQYTETLRSHGRQIGTLTSRLDRLESRIDHGSSRRGSGHNGREI